MTAALFLWFGLTQEGRTEPMPDNLLHLLPATIAAVVVSGVLLGMQRVRAPFLTAALVGFTATLCFAFCLHSHAQGWALYLLFLALPVPLVFAALRIGARVPRGRLRTPAAWAVVATALLITDAAMRYPVAQVQQQRAADALASYDAVSVLDAPGWALTHAYDRSAFPELVYRDLLGRTVLLGSTPGRPVESDHDGDIAADMLAPEKCAARPEGELFVVDCKVQAGMLVVRMEGAPSDRGAGDDTDRWPNGWTEVRTQSADGRYVRLRSDSPGVDLVGLAESIEDAPPTAPEAAVVEASCLLRCPVWWKYGD